MAKVAEHFDKVRFDANRAAAFARHELGSQSLDEARPYGKAREIATSKSVSPAILCAARHFAAEISSKELKRIFKAAERERFPVTLSHLTVFMTIPRNDRERFEQRMISEHMSVATLKASVKRRYGNRNHVGRQPQTPMGVHDCWMQIERRGLACSRWAEAFADFLKNRPGGKGNRRVKAERLLRQLQRTAESLRDVADKVQRTRSKSR